MVNFLRVGQGIVKQFPGASSFRVLAVFAAILLLAAAASCGRTESSNAVILEQDFSPTSTISPSSAAPQDYGLSDIAYSYFSASSASDTPGSLADFAGRPLVVNFWASWCPPCVREMPEIETVYQSLQSQIAFLGINVTDEREDALELMEQTGASYLQATDPDGVIQLRLGAVIMPTTLFVSSEGEVLDRWQGILDESSLRDKIAENFEIS